MLYIECTSDTITLKCRSVSIIWCTTVEGLCILTSVYIIHRIMYSVQCTVYIVHSVHCTINFISLLYMLYNICIV